MARLYSLRLISDVPPDRIIEVARSVAEECGLETHGLSRALSGGAGTLILKAAAGDLVVRVGAALHREGVLSDAEVIPDGLIATERGATTRPSGAPSDQSRFGDNLGPTPKSQAEGQAQEAANSGEGLRANSQGAEGASKKRVVKETRCTCNACGRVWYFGRADWDDELMALGTQLTCCGLGCLPGLLALPFTNRFAGGALERKSRCPDCGSRAITIELVEHHV